MALVIATLHFTDEPRAVAESELSDVHKLFIGVEYDESGVGYVRAKSDDETKPEVVRKEGQNVVKHSALGCSPYAHAVLHRLLRGNFRLVDYKPQQAFGGAKIAEHYELSSAGAWTLDEFTTAAAAKKLPNGVFFFDLRNAAGWKDGRNTEYKAGMHGHVGFIAVDGDQVRQYQFSDKYKGPSGTESFIDDYLPWSVYAKSGGAKSSQIELYRLNKS